MIKICLLATMLAVLCAAACAADRDPFSEPTAVPKGWMEMDAFAETTPAPKGSAEDSAAGFVPYTRPCVDPVFRLSRPRAEEVTDAFNVRLARNEYEPVIVALYGLRDLKGISLTVGELASGKYTFGRNAVEIRRIDMRAVRARKRPKKSYKVVPKVLPLTATADLTRDHTTTFWITVHAAPQVRAGIYEGPLDVMHQGKRLRRMTLRVRVSPITLEDIPGMTYACLYTPCVLALPKHEPNARLVLRDLRAHGMTAYSPQVHAWGKPLTWRDGTPSHGVPMMVRHLCWAKEEGLSQPTILNISKLLRTGRPGLDAEYTKFEPGVDGPNLKRLIAYIEAERKRHGLPAIYYMPADEVGCFTDKTGTRRMEIAIQLCKIIEEAGGRAALTLADPVGDKYQSPRWKCAGWLDKLRAGAHLRIYGNGYPGKVYPLSAEVADARKRGHVAMMYENGSTMGHRPAVSRIYFGFYGYALRCQGVSGITSWTYPLVNNATGHHVWGPDWTVRKAESKAYANDANFRLYPTTICWEMCREGIDDARYLFQLEKSMAQDPQMRAKHSGLLTEIMTAVAATGMAKQKGPEDTESALVDWPGSKFRAFRERVVKALEEPRRGR